MSSTRVLLAALIGGIVMFVWGAVAHMALPLGEMGIQSLPAEPALVPTMKQEIRERGFYFFPGRDMKDKSQAAQDAWVAKLRDGPRGVVIYDPTGSEMMSFGQLGTEFASNVFAAFVATVILGRIRGNWLSRTLLAGGMGVLAWLSIDASYWNWYRFPTAFAAAGLVEQAVGWLLTGAAIVATLGRVRPAQA